jgi:RNA polymerase sigma factor (sigma-70 family)
VLAVCRRVLAHEADAEDAFQATFVVLARRAGAVARRESVGSFLYGVAVRTALRARSSRENRRRRERRVAAMAETASAHEMPANDLRPVLDEELAALPARYREPLRLCYLEGRTYDEAARALGCARGTVASRVARGRERLRARLAARGVAPSAAVLASALAARASASAVPASLLSAALRAAARACAGAAGRAALAPRVRELAEGAAREAARARLRVVGVLLLAVCAAGVVAVAAPRGRRGPGPETDVVEGPATPAARAGTWQMAARLGVSLRRARSALFSPDGRYLAEVTADGVLRLWDTATWQERCRYAAGRDNLAMRFSPDGRLLSLNAVVRDPEPLKSNHGPTAVVVLESATGREAARFPARTGAFVPDGSALVTWNDDDTLTFWDPHTFARRFDVKEVPRGSLPVPTFSPDGRLLCTWGNDVRSARLWETADGRLRGRPEGCYPEFARDGKHLVTCVPGGAKVWDCATGRETAALRGPRDWGAYAFLSPDGGLVLTSTGPATPLRFAADAYLKTDATPGGGPSDSLPLDVRLWDARTGAERARFGGTVGSDDHSGFSPDGRTVVYARREPGGMGREELVLWDVAVGRERAVLRSAKGVSSGTFSRDGRFLFTADIAGGDVRVWDPATGERLPDLPGAGRMAGAVLSPDGTMLAGNWNETGYSPLIGQTELVVFRLTDGPAPPPVQRGTAAPAGSFPLTNPGISSAGVSPGPAPNVVPKPAPDNLPRGPAPTEAAKALDALVKESMGATGEYHKTVLTALTEPKRESLRQQYGERQAAFAARALQIARENPTDPAAMRALAFVLGPGIGLPGPALGRVREEALAQIRKDLLPSRHVTELLPLFSGLNPGTANGLLAAMAECNRYPCDRGQAALMLADALARQADHVRQRQAAPDRAGSRPAGQAPGRDPPGQPDPDALERDAARWYTLVRDKYGDLADPGRRNATLGEPAERGLFAMLHLGIGKEAPEIAGEDLEGKPLKLSDHRGKVVVLFFCGNWSGSWRPLNPQKRHLVERLAGKPFALLEVVSDNDPEPVRRAMRDEGLTWRCWFDKGRPGPISLRWNVPFVAAYVLDASGVIRYKGLPGGLLDEAADRVVRELTGRPVRPAGREGGTGGPS